MVAAHFTQIVWESTTRLGLSLIENVDGNLIVATYYPAGNQIDKYTANVKRPNTNSDLFTQLVN